MENRQQVSRATVCKHATLINIEAYKQELLNDFYWERSKFMVRLYDLITYKVDKDYRIYLYLEEQNPVKSFGALKYNDVVAFYNRLYEEVLNVPVSTAMEQLVPILQEFTHLVPLCQSPEMRELQYIITKYNGACVAEKFLATPIEAMRTLPK